MTPRQRVVKYLVKITKNQPVEQQLRQQWLRELQALKQSNLIFKPGSSKYLNDSTQ